MTAVRQERPVTVTVLIAGRPSAQSDAALARWFEKFLEREQPGTRWQVTDSERTP